MNVPSYLKTTYDMLESAYPNQISDEEYFALLHILYDNMCDENLSLVMSLLVNKNIAEITNDIYQSCHMHFDSALLLEAEHKLNKNGFESWKQEN